MLGTGMIIAALPIFWVTMKKTKGRS